MVIGGVIVLGFYGREGRKFVVKGSLIVGFFYLVVIGRWVRFSV